MSEIPTWWLVVSGVFFLVALVAAGVLANLLLQLTRVLKDIEPKIVALTERVDSIGQKVESIAVKVDGMASSAKTSVEIVGSKAQGIASGAEALGLLAGRKAAGASQYVVLGTMLYRLISGFIASRRHKSNS